MHACTMQQYGWPIEYKISVIGHGQLAAISDGRLHTVEFHIHYKTSTRENHGQLIYQ